MLEAGSLMPIAFPAWSVAAALEEDLDEIENACDELRAELDSCSALAMMTCQTGHALISTRLFTASIARSYIKGRLRRGASRHVHIAERLR